MNLMLCEPEDPDALADLDGDEWLAERKLDGVRIVAEEGTLRTRSGRDVTANFPEIDPPDAHTFDGEVVTTDFRFESVLRRVQTEDRFKVEMLAERSPARLVAFDALTVNGEDVRERPLSERKELLGPSIPSDSGLVEITAHADLTALWEQAKAEAWEGIICKRRESPYREGRQDTWRKLKLWKEGEFPILDYGRTDNDGFVIRVGVGDEEPQKVVVNGEADQADVRSGADAAEVQYLERTDEGRLRKPSFKGVA